ncbi:helix-turn-helix transcriptional regulator [Paenibacillus tuaregi]|uniref:helix-turn-helix transcriptional regulator n=1 Tax=Paenibacillus tuaregi TaxID=1816681 RepID=UPI0008396E61|nr:AraC family transcriptional regulator [Paenibacillus tuaregi]
MPLLQFNIPPLPYFIVSGLAELAPGSKHPARRSIGVFDLLVVVEGCLYVGEEDRHYEIKEGHSLILRPDAYHYPTMACTEVTRYYWIHFHTSGEWSAADETGGADMKDKSAEPPLFLPFYSITPFSIRVPQFTELLQPDKLYATMQELTQMNQSIHLPSVRLRQQALFQDVIQQLSDTLTTEAPSPQTACAERAAAFLRAHYQEEITSKVLGEFMNFHPVYIARCMQKVFGCSPAAYLLRYRIARAKLLLLQTDLSVTRISEEVGFNHPAYFTSSFVKQEGLSPRKFRQHFS